MALKTNAADVTGYLSTGVSNIPGTNAVQSVCFWFNVGSYPSSSTPVSYINLVSLASSTAIQIGSISSAFTIWGFTRPVLITASSNPSVNVNHHAVYTFDGTTRRLYFDGVLSNSSIVANGAGVVDTIQIFGNQWLEIIEITMEDIRIYNRDLSLDEIGTIYSCQGTDTIVYGMVSRWLLNEGSEFSSLTAVTDIKDSGISGNNGTSITGSITNYTYQGSELKFKRKTI